MSSYATHQISKLTAVLQPIVSVQRGRILGFEALCRHRESMPGSSPAFIFEQAITQGWRPELEYACLHNACAAFRNSKEHFESSLLFINVDAQVVSQDEEDYRDNARGQVVGPYRRFHPGHHRHEMLKGAFDGVSMAAFLSRV